MKNSIKSTAFLLAFFISSIHAQESCIFCHTDSAYTAAFDSSRHGLQNIRCADCHIKARGVAEFVWEKYIDLLTFSSKNVHSASQASTENCRSCHRASNQLNIIAEGALPEQLKTIGLVFEHKKHADLRDSCMSCHKEGTFTENKILSRIGRADPMGCASCHLNVVHEAPSKYGYPIPKEKDCANCHNSKNTCPAMKEISDIKDDKRCTGCHPNQYTF